MTERAHRFVVSRRTAGLGDCLISLCGAWHYARQTGRTLVIDWRWSRYVRERNKNAFAVFFEPLTEVEGVPVISDDSVATLKYPSPIYSRHAKKKGLKRLLGQIAHNLIETKLPFVFNYQKAAADELAIIRSAQDVVEPTIIFRCCLPAFPMAHEAHALFLAHLKPQKAIQDEIDRYARENFAGRKVIAVHVRHGNGGNILNHRKHWLDESRALDEICHKIQSAQAELGGDRLVFLCTDSRKVLEFIRSRVPNVMAREKYFRPDNRGELHARKTISARNGSDSGREALIEMFLLARCDALLCYPEGSYFSYYARTCGSGVRRC
jgi:hypothetical protein